MDVSDAAAVARARAGDAEAFRALVERHSRSIFRLAYRITGNEQDAEDIVQESLLKAYRQLHRFESRANFGTWLYRITANCAIDSMRSRPRHQAPPEADEGDGIDRPLPSDDPSPERLVFGCEVKAKVASALETMSAMERAAFTLRHFEGMSIEEIGQSLGLRANATKHSIFRAVRKLRRELEPILGSIK